MSKLEESANLVEQNSPELSTSASVPTAHPGDVSQYETASASVLSRTQTSHFCGHFYCSSDARQKVMCARPSLVGGLRKYIHLLFLSARIARMGRCDRILISGVDRLCMTVVGDDDAVGALHLLHCAGDGLTCLGAEPGATAGLFHHSTQARILLLIWPR